jgi:hypothetical protein
MSNRNAFIRQLIEVELKMGFLNIPKAGQEIMPSSSGKISVKLAGEDEKQLTYNADYYRIFGLTRWYKKNDLHVGDFITVERSGNKFLLSTHNATTSTDSLTKAEQLIDISGLSSQAKGHIMEDRVKELLILYGQGLLNVYRPVVDTEGIDLIILRNGMFHPIFLQVKSNFTAHKRGNMILDISAKTFKPHHSYFIVGVSFNSQNLEIDENILLIPSHEVKRIGQNINSYNKIRITASIKGNAMDKWAGFMLKKQQLAEKLLEKFSQLDEILK